MSIRELMKGLNIKRSSCGEGAEIRSITLDSRNAGPGAVFVALKGAHLDGHAFTKDALMRGASCAVVEKAPEGVSDKLIEVPDTYAALARISANFYGNPSENMIIAGITGTNGKTTTASLLKDILEGSGKKTGLIGTLGFDAGEGMVAGTHTTPMAPDFQKILSVMAESGCTHAVSEVSSHALSQRRADATRFMAAVFTNLTRDHLDFHITMDEYFKAKARLFTEMLDRKGVAVVNIDDAYGKRLAKTIDRRIITAGIEEAADLRAFQIENNPDGLRMSVSYLKEAHTLESGLSGVPNAYNILSAVGAALGLGVGWDDIKKGIASAKAVKGRFEKVEAGQDFLVIVDYAHTEDALERLIKTARAITKGRIITVFGCGGDRDRGKRPEMGRIASELSDMAIITSDNPRSEDPLAIIREIENGISKGKYEAIPDRREAVRKAISSARKGDTVLLAGKGHEDYQEINGARTHFSDLEEAASAIKELWGR